MSQLEARIRDLEEKLLHSDPTVTPGIIDELLEDGFEEIGITGRVTPREQVVEWLRSKARDTRWALTDFKIRELAENLVLATYRARTIQDSPSRGSMHSSIWQRQGDGWQLVFHQGTRITGD